jgi:hypothetical protein
VHAVNLGPPAPVAPCWEAWRGPAACARRMQQLVRAEYRDTCQAHTDSEHASLRPTRQPAAPRARGQNTTFRLLVPSCKSDSSSNSRRGAFMVVSHAAPEMPGRGR